MIKLKSYQEDAIKAIKNGFNKKSRQYVEMPTGSGKTITFLHYAKTYHKKVLVIVPSKQLLRQVYESALLFYEEGEISRKGDGWDEEPNMCYLWNIPPKTKEDKRFVSEINCIHIAIINSIRGDQVDYLARLCSFDLVVIDEAHHSQSASYQRFINAACQYDSPPLFLGMTATPDRSDGKLLKDILYDCTFKLGITDLIEKKQLSDIEGFSVKTKIDLSDIDDHNGDFNVSQLYKKLCTDSRNRMIVDLCKKEMKDRKVIIFCINIAHSKSINEMLAKEDIASSHIDGHTPNDIRTSILNSFRSGDIQVLCNCQLLTEGFDEPSIDGIILSRPTRSRGLFLQMIGRGLRLSPGKKNCKIIDIVDNHKNLAGFTSIVTEEHFRDIDSFRNLKDIKDYVEEKRLEIIETTVVRTNLFQEKSIDLEEATDSQIQFLQDNEIQYFEPISFDEASFLKFMVELKKEYENGNIRKTSAKKR